jgi:hypothetical protein
LAEQQPIYIVRIFSLTKRVISINQILLKNDHRPIFSKTQKAAGKVPPLLRALRK